MKKSQMLSISVLFFMIAIISASSFYHSQSKEHEQKYRSSIRASESILYTVNALSAIESISGFGSEKIVMQDYLIAKFKYLIRNESNAFENLDAYEKIFENKKQGIIFNFSGLKNDLENGFMERTVVPHNISALFFTQENRAIYNNSAEIKEASIYLSMQGSIEITGCSPSLPEKKILIYTLTNENHAYLDSASDCEIIAKILSPQGDYFLSITGNNSANYLQIDYSEPFIDFESSIELMLEIKGNLFKIASPYNDLIIIENNGFLLKKSLE